MRLHQEVKPAVDKEVLSRQDGLHYLCGVLYLLMKASELPVVIKFYPPLWEKIK